jgi:hypothetical protein
LLILEVINLFPLHVGQSIPKTGEWNFGLKPKPQAEAVSSFVEPPVTKLEDVLGHDEIHDAPAAQPDNDDDEIDLL